MMGRRTISHSPLLHRLSQQQRQRAWRISPPPKQRMSLSRFPQNALTLLPRPRPRRPSSSRCEDLKSCKAASMRCDNADRHLCSSLVYSKALPCIKAAGWTRSSGQGRCFNSASSHASSGEWGGGNAWQQGRMHGRHFMRTCLCMLTCQAVHAVLSGCLCMVNLLLLLIPTTQHRHPRPEWDLLRLPVGPRDRG